MKTKVTAAPIDSCEETNDDEKGESEDGGYCPNEYHDWDKFGDEDRAIFSGSRIG